MPAPEGFDTFADAVAKLTELTAGGSEIPPVIKLIGTRDQLAGVVEQTGDPAVRSLLEVYDHLIAARTAADNGQIASGQQSLDRAKKGFVALAQSLQ